VTAETAAVASPTQARNLPPPTLGRLVNLALPIVISRASYSVMLFVNRLFLSRVGKHELAASMSGGLTSMVLSAFVEGVVGYVTALVAQYYGAESPEKCTQSTTQAVYLALASYPVLLAFMPLIRVFFRLTGQEPALAELAIVYGQMLLWGSILVILRIALGSFFIGIGRTRIVMVANIVAALASVPANYLLVFGKLGLPAMGIRGAALGTMIGSLASLVVLLWTYLRTINRAPYRCEGAWRLRPELMRRLLRFGIPTGVEPFLTWFAFNLFVQFMHSYGPDTAAAATIAFNFDAMAFVPMLGLGTAATSIVAQYLGARNPDGAEEAVRLTIRVAIGYSVLLVALFVGLTRPLVAIFSSGFESAGGDVATMAESMLRLLALYILANSCKLVHGGSLRAAGDTAWPMRAAIALHWVMAAATFWLVRVVGAHQFVSWSTLIIMNNIQSLALWYRYGTKKWRGMALIG